MRKKPMAKPLHGKLSRNRGNPTSPLSTQTQQPILYINKYGLEKNGGQLYNINNSIDPRRWIEFDIKP